MWQQQETDGQSTIVLEFCSEYTIVQYQVQSYRPCPAVYNELVTTVGNTVQHAPQY